MIDKRVIFLMVFVAPAALAPIAAAHEVRPCFLSLRETADGRFAVVWKTPTSRGARLPMRPVFPPHCVPAAQSQEKLLNAFIERWLLDCGDEGIEGHRVFFEGPPTAMTDTLVRIEWRDGRTRSFLVRARDPVFTIPTRPTATRIAWEYFVLGGEHILLGADHLLFVLALLLIVQGSWRLVKAVTAFTLAHSITLTAAVLGFVHVPAAPVEAVIALSIVFLATELMRVREGRDSLTTRRPWVVSLCFGLLHGFGFAGALSEIGLPEQAIPMALALFNVGVEAGQLAFVIVVLGIMRITRHMKLPRLVWIRQLAVYSIGSLASFWLIERVLGFWD